MAEPEAQDAERLARRRAILRDYGANEAETAELQAYNASPYEASRLRPGLSLPIAPEPYITAWERYAAEAQSVGAFEALRRRFPQLSFPIQEGISATESYRAATLRGEPVTNLPEATGLILLHPEDLQLQMHRSLAGPVPVLVPAGREDFVMLVRALSMRNEPKPVPDSQGAATVKGFNNWDRIWEYRDRWREQPGGRDSDAAWNAEFQRLIPQKALYQDHFIILSDGPYSNVGAAQLDLSEVAWRQRSLAIRAEHECTHTLTLRAFGVSQNNALDEMLCDYMGIVAAAGRFRADWLDLFMGLESLPQYREGGRLQNYLGEPPLSAGAFVVLQRLVHDTGQALERFDSAAFGADSTIQMRGPALLGLACLTLEEIAAGDQPPLMTSTMPVSRL